MFFRLCICAFIFVSLFFESKAQFFKKLNNDTVFNKKVDTITVYTRLNKENYTLPNTEGANIYSGKKTNYIEVNQLNANLSQALTRQIFAKIPGLTTWDMDGAGTQINIGSRGTDSHRSIEMNMRQNGYNTNSDMFGYPEDHYTPPMQAIQSIQLIRGSAALQYGSQFGGMMNYVMKSGDALQSPTLEIDQTAGSNNFFNAYFSLGGTKDKLSYYSYFDYKHGDGWRSNSIFNYHAYYADLKYSFSKKINIAFQFSRMAYVQQIAGGLTDDQFQKNNCQSFRSRNYFNPEINIPAIIFKYTLSAYTQLQITSHFLFGQRNSVQFINNPNILDTFNTSISSYNPRQVDRDYYQGLTIETRLLHQYKFAKQISSLAAGVRLFDEITRRRQKGIGTTGSDFDLTIINPYAINLNFRTVNAALFAENLFQISSKVSITPGIRYEFIRSEMSGFITGNINEYYLTNRNLLLTGIGIQYTQKGNNQLYANISQEYRPNLYATYTPSGQVDSIDTNLKDSKGYDIDLGYRGSIGNLARFDINFFYVFYGNRTGLISINTPTSPVNLLTTNIGDAVSKGFEAFIEFSFAKWLNLNKKNNDILIFNSLSYTHGRYTNAIINKSGSNISLSGNYIENTPEWNNKIGLNVIFKKINTSLQYTYVSKYYNDALNTIYSSNGVIGVIPSYKLFDLTCSFSFNSNCSLGGGINNLLNEKYFSRRITMYPGPGILPADGRTYYITLKLKVE
ncbi:MAG: TonB-dependent receptor [Sphingobacteriia bacterium]|nr:TonB-dependent receptor [Sphingobacteriia bacterium]